MLCLETSLSFSSPEYIVYENDTQVTLTLRSSNITSTVFGIELHIIEMSAAGRDDNECMCIDMSGCNRVILLMCRCRFRTLINV